MKKVLRSYVTLLVVLSLTLSLVGTVSAAGDDKSAGDYVTTEEMQEYLAIAQRALDMQEVKNIASQHEYYHSALMHEEELENIWAQDHDITWTNNTTSYVGYDAVYKFYVTDLDSMISMAQEAMHELYGIEITEETEGMGILWYHMLTSPVIEIAGDGQTAKGIWQSFGTVTVPESDGMSQQITFENYGMDFVKEDGEWKLWHLRTYVLAYTEQGEYWWDPATNAAVSKSPSTPDTSDDVQCTLSPQTITVDGSAVSVQAYNINGNNFVKLRDLASLLNGTKSQFEVGFDANAMLVTATTGQSYTAVGGECATLGDQSGTCTPSTWSLQVNGEAASVTCYNIGNNNYFMLRDLAMYLGYSMEYDETANTAAITTGVDTTDMTVTPDMTPPADMTPPGRDMTPPSSMDSSAAGSSGDSSGNSSGDSSGDSETSGVLTGNFFEGYSYLKVPTLEPKIPEPYYTFDETFSY